MSRAKLLVENFFAYGAINIINKIVPFLLLPIITRMLSDPSDFGIYDMYNLVVGFGAPIAMLGVYDAMFREYFEKEEEQYKYKVTSTASTLVFVSSILVSIVLIVFRESFSQLFYNDRLFAPVIILSAIELVITANKQMISAPTRLQNKRKIYVISGLLQSLSYYGFAILLIYMGLSYWGMIFSNIVSTLLVLLFFWKLNQSFFSIMVFDKKIAKELLRIGIPLLPSLMIMWIFNSMDRIMITNILGTKELGIYSIGARIASVSSIIYSAFVGGWQYFAFHTMRDQDYKKMMGTIWESLFIIVSCFFVIGFLMKNIVFDILFLGEYRNGVIVFPFLFLSPLLQMLQQVLGTQFHVIKKTYYSPLILSFGAIVNLCLNYWLIPLMGIEGAAIATMLGFITVLIMSIVIVVIKLRLVDFNNSTYALLGIFATTFGLLYMYDVNIMTTILGLSYILIVVIRYRKRMAMFLRSTFQSKT